MWVDYIPSRIGYPAGGAFIAVRPEHADAADPSIWDRSRGPSIAEMAEKAGLYFTRGDNKRLPGWMQCHRRLRFDENGRAGMYVFSNCEQFIRTIPLLRYSHTDPEDADSSGEDHIADEWRYACMSRPMPAPRPVPEEPLRWFRDPLKR